MMTVPSTDLKSELNHYIFQTEKEMRFLTDMLQAGDYRPEAEAELRASLAFFTARHEHARRMWDHLVAAELTLLDTWREGDNPIVREIVTDYETRGTLRF
jgi:hypothetical protein